MSQQSEVSRRLAEIDTYLDKHERNPALNALYPDGDIRFLRQQLRDLQRVARRMVEDEGTMDAHLALEALRDKLEELGGE